MAHAWLQVGGFEAYLLADEDKEGEAAAEVYRSVRSIFIYTVLVFERGEGVGVKGF